MNVATLARRLARVSPPLNASTALSGVTASASSLLSDGIETVTLTFRVVNTSNVAIVGATVTIPALANCTFSTPAVTDTDGLTTCTLSTTTTGDKVVAWKANGIAMTETVTVTGTASQTADATETTISAADTTVTNGGTVAVTVQAKVAGGANKTIGGDTVTLALSGGTATGTITSPAVDNGDGTYSATFTGTGVGTATTVTGTINSVTISGGTLPTIAVTAAASYTPGDILNNSTFTGSSWGGLWKGSGAFSNTPTAFCSIDTGVGYDDSTSIKKPMPIIAEAGGTLDQTTGIYYGFYGADGQNGYTHNGSGEDRLYGRFYFKPSTTFDTSTDLKLSVFFRGPGFGTKMAEFGFHQGYLVYGYKTEWNGGNIRICSLAYLATDPLSNGGWHSLEWDLQFNGNLTGDGFANTQIWFNDVDIATSCPAAPGGEPAPDAIALAASPSAGWVNGRLTAGSRTAGNTGQKLTVWSSFNVLNDGNNVDGNSWMDYISLSTLGRVGP